MQIILFFLETLNKHFFKGFQYLHSPVGYAREIRSGIIFRGFKGKIGFLNRKQKQSSWLADCFFWQKISPFVLETKGL